MNARFDEAVWAGVVRRLSEIEAYLPDAPAWGSSSATAELTGTVRAGTAFGRPSTQRSVGRRRLVLALAVVGTLLALVAAALLVGALRTEIDRRDELFGPLGIFRSSDAGSSATVLKDGRVLIVSGAWVGMGTVAAPLAYVWDPVRGRGSTGTPVYGRVGATATLLLDGRVLVAGGFGGPYAYASSAVASAEIWDPATGMFEETGAMRERRVGHTATLLPDGRVLVIGGGGPGGPHASAEVWDPASGSFLPAGSMATSVGAPEARGGHTATLLSTGDVLVIGTIGGAQIWRSASETFWRADWSLMGEFMTATALLDGRVLLITGTAPQVSQPNPAVAVTADGRAPVSLGALLEPRTRYAATLLADGRVLITGGVRGSAEELGSAEIWDPETGSSRPAEPLDRPVADHMALLVPDGRVLIVFDVVGPDGRAEPFIYDPSAPGASE